MPFSTAGLNTSTLRSLNKRYALSAKPLLWILGHAPYERLKPLLINASLKHISKASDEEYKYMKDFFTWAFRDYTQAFDVHMTSLLIDIMNQRPCRREEFAYLKGKVLLILPDDDETFTREMQRGLISLFDEPYVAEHVTGGHLAPIMQTEKYTRNIMEFINERIVCLNRSRRLYSMLLSLLYGIIGIVLLTAFCLIGAFSAPQVAYWCMTPSAKKLLEEHGISHKFSLKGKISLAILTAVICVLYVLTIISAGKQGVTSGMNFRQLTLRFVIFFWMISIFDAVVLDWWMFTRTKIFGILIRQKTGKAPRVWSVEPQWDGKEIHKLIIEVIVSALLAWIFLKVFR